MPDTSDDDGGGGNVYVPPGRYDLTDDDFATLPILDLDKFRDSDDGQTHFYGDGCDDDHGRVITDDGDNDATG